jgi:hypothetical protein
MPLKKNNENLEALIITYQILSKMIILKYYKSSLMAQVKNT